MDLEDLKQAIAAIFPGDAPLTAEQVNSAWAQLSTQAVPVTREYRVTAMTLAADLGIAAAGRVLTAVRTAAAGNPLVEEILFLMRSGVGVDVNHTATRTQIDSLVAAQLLSADDGAALKHLADATVPKWPQITVEEIQKARAL
jgi:hypothetical protein